MSMGLCAMTDMQLVSSLQRNRFLNKTGFEPKRPAAYSAGQNVAVAGMITSTCWHLASKFNKVKSILLVDTCSIYTLVNVEFYHSIPIERCPPFDKVYISLVSTEGSNLKVHGETMRQGGGAIFRL